MFDKKLYWQRRKENKRGQDSLPEPKLIKESGVMLGFTKGGKPVAKNRRQRRQKLVSRLYTKKGYVSVKSELGIWFPRRINGN